MALSFAFKNPKPQFTPTLFVVACQNYKGIDAVTMDSEAYSAYPSESEILFCEGSRMFVLAVDTGVKIRNTTEGEMAAFNGKEINVIHFFHAS